MISPIVYWTIFGLIIIGFYLVIWAVLDAGARADERYPTVICDWCGEILEMGSSEIYRVRCSRCAGESPHVAAI